MRTIAEIFAGAVFVAWAFYLLLTSPYLPQYQQSVKGGALAPNAAEDAYFARTGKYLQVKDNNTLPQYETGDVQSKLGQTLPATTVVNVYETAKGGEGYQVRTEDALNYYYQGYGPEASSFTYTISKAYVANQK